MNKIRLYLGLLSFVFVFAACKTNQKRDKSKQGIWVSTDTLGTDLFKTVEHFKKNIEVRTSRFYKNGKIYKKEKHKGDICYTTYYYSNGKIQSKGKTKIVLEDGKPHWLYFDNW